jgi:hypothetical protein
VTLAARGQGRSHAARLAEEGVDIIPIDLCKQLLWAKRYVEYIREQGLPPLPPRRRLTHQKLNTTDQEEDANGNPGLE